MEDSRLKLFFVGREVRDVQENAKLGLLGFLILGVVVVPYSITRSRWYIDSFIPESVIEGLVLPVLGVCILIPLGYSAIVSYRRGGLLSGWILSLGITIPLWVLFAIITYRLPETFPSIWFTSIPVAVFFNSIFATAGSLLGRLSRWLVQSP